jgi:hypothetical protein
MAGCGQGADHDGIAHRLEITMHLLTHLTHLPRPFCPKAPDRRRPTPAPRRDDESSAEERPPGCGWFDSSHDLQSGLRVTEHAQADAVVNQIPLSWWLGWELDAALSSVRR